MNVLQIAYKSTITGGEMVLWDVTRGLVARGENVRVISNAEGPLLDAVRADGAQTDVVAIGNTYSVPSVLRIARYLKTHNIDIVQSHGLRVNILASFAARLAGTPVCISTEHCVNALGVGGHTWGTLSKWKGHLYHCILDNWSTRYRDRCICVSNAVREDRIAQGVNPHKLVTVLNGIDLDRFSFLKGNDTANVKREIGVDPDAPLIGTIARLSWAKDIETLVHAMRMVWAHCPEAHLAVVGDGPQTERLQEYTRRNGGEGKVHFLGFREDARELMAAFDVFALPSLWEAFGIVFLEAMACGIPVVCTACPGSLEAVKDGETALTVSRRNPGALAQALLALLNDPEKRRIMGAAGRARVEAGFTAQHMVEQTVALYNAVLCEKNMPLLPS